MNFLGYLLNTFLYLSKVFDTVDHNVLIAKLKEYGIHDVEMSKMAV